MGALVYSPSIFASTGRMGLADDIKEGNAINLHGFIKQRIGSHMPHLSADFASIIFPQTTKYKILPQIFSVSLDIGTILWYRVTD